MDFSIYMYMCTLKNHWCNTKRKKVYTMYIYLTFPLVQLANVTFYLIKGVILGGAENTSPQIDQLPSLNSITVYHTGSYMYIQQPGWFDTHRQTSSSNPGVLETLSSFSVCVCVCMFTCVLLFCSYLLPFTFYYAAICGVCGCMLLGFSITLSYIPYSTV